MFEHAASSFSLASNHLNGSIRIHEHRNSGRNIKFGPELEDICFSNGSYSSPSSMKTKDKCKCSVPAVILTIVDLRGGMPCVCSHLTAMLAASWAHHLLTIDFTKTFDNCSSSTIFVCSRCRDELRSQGFQISLEFFMSLARVYSEVSLGLRSS